MLSFLSWVLTSIFPRITLDHVFCRIWDCQPLILSAIVDHVEAVLYQHDQPVAQKMHTGLFYWRALVLRKNILKFLSLFMVRNLLFFPIFIMTLHTNLR